MEDIVCNFCGDRFPSEEILTEHISKNHRDGSERHKQPNEAKSFGKQLKLTCKYCEENLKVK